MFLKHGTKNSSEIHLVAPTGFEPCLLLTLHFPDPVASAVESEDAAVRAAVGHLGAELIAGRAPDHADARIRLDGPDGRRRPAGLRGEWWDRARQGAGVEPLAHPQCDGVLIHVPFPPCPVRRRLILRTTSLMRRMAARTLAAASPVASFAAAVAGRSAPLRIAPSTLLMVSPRRSLSSFSRFSSAARTVTSVWSASTWRSASSRVRISSRACTSDESTTWW